MKRPWNRKGCLRNEDGERGDAMRRNWTFVSAASPVFFLSSGLCEEGGYALLHAGGQSFNLGPTGILAHMPEGAAASNFFVVDKVEAGSPAHGLIVEHDVIAGVNGKPFPAEGDTRIHMAHAIIDSEAKDGRLHLQISRGNKPMEVVLQLDRVPDYSPTWPFDCPRTEVMLANACDFLAREQAPDGKVEADDGWIGPTQAGLLWLAMGEPRYLDNARRAAYWFMETIQDPEKRGGFGTWKWGNGGLLLAEYYEMTGDRGVLPGLKLVGEIVAGGQMPSGGWSHGFYEGYGAGYGEINSAGMVCYMALLLAKECGVTVDAAALKRAEAYYDKFAPTLTNVYGDHFWKFQGYDTMNGKVGGLAVAHRLNDRGVESAGHALKAARSFNTIETGHTGHFFNLLWSQAGASLAPAREYRQGMDQIGWYYALARTWRGGFVCQPHGRKGAKYWDYGPNMTTAGIGLGLAVCKRHLRILGAPKSVFVREDLPAELKAARELHQSSQWDQAIAAVDEFLKKGGRDAETVRLAHELRDKARYVKAGIDLTLAMLDRYSEGGKIGARAYEVEQMLVPMRRLLGDKNPRLQAIEDRLPEKSLEIWSRGKSYYEAFQLLRQLSVEVWFRYSHLVNRAIPDLAMPAEDPVWTSITGEADGAWKAFLVPQMADAPSGWSSPTFDDSTWKGPTDGQNEDAGKKGRSKPKQGCQLVRCTFDLKDPLVKKLRINVAGKPGLASAAEVYLNGELVLKTFTGVGKGSVDLLRRTRELLRKGRNVLAYATTTEGGLPKLALEAELISSAGTPFAWTEVPGRDAEIRGLRAERRWPHPYFDAAQDKRSVEQLMQVFCAEPFFMPETYYALERFRNLVPAAEQSKYVAELLKSTSWGARWTGVYLVDQAFTPMDGKTLSRLSEEDRAKKNAEYKGARIMCETFKGQIVQMLKDPHPLVRCQAAGVVINYGSSAKEAIPALLALVGDREGQNWWVREQAFKALQEMPLDKETIQTVTRLGLKDPSSYARKAVYNTTFLAKDEAVRKEACRIYKDEMIQQVFDAPHGMATRGMRNGAANMAVASLSREDLLAYLPRFLEALRLPKGDTLSGSMRILAACGDEVLGKLETLAESPEMTVRVNALATLQLMAMRDDASPALVARIRQRLESAVKSNQADLAEKVQRLLKSLDAQKKQEELDNKNEQNKEKE